MTAPTPNQMPGAQAPAGEAPPAIPPAADAPPASPASEKKPPWGSDAEFNPERAWTLIQNVRGENDQLKQKLADAQPALDAAEQQRRTEQGELATAREDATKAAEREATWRAEAIRAKAEALAAGRFVDAETALALIGDVSGYTTADGGIDIAKLQARLDQLAADKPFLVAAAPPPPGFTPNRGQGQSGAGQPSVNEQIKAAQARGDVMGSIALKQQQFYQK